MRRFFLYERNADFFAACEMVRSRDGLYAVRDIAKAAINEPADSFYITTKQYLNIIQRMRCLASIPEGVVGDMYREIFKRYWEIKKQHPKYSTTKIAQAIDAQTAPRFYMSVSQATKILYKHYRERKCNI